MNVNMSNCLHCQRRLHYAEARLLPEGGGVCPECAAGRGYCRDYFVPAGEDEHFCGVCLRRIFERFA